MITKFKIYENVELLDLKVGGYVTMSSEGLAFPGSSTGQKKTLNYFLSNNIGVVLKINEEYKFVKVRYHNIPLTIQTIFFGNSYVFNISRIEEYASTVEEIKMKIDANKYNI